MQQGLGALVVIGLLALAGASALQCQTVRYIQAPTQAAAPAAPIEPPVIEELPRFKAPRAILALDVSASMRQGDPQHLQTEAVLQFFDTYNALSREVLESGDYPAIAIVLFATIAQTVVWTDAADPWLVVSDQTREEFRRVVIRYLGEGADEPRTGQDTDYLAALTVVDKLASAQVAPPIVVFLTDGSFDLNPFFSQVMPTERRDALTSRLSSATQKQLAQARGGDFDRLPAGSAPAILDTRTLGLQPAELPADLRGDARAAILRAKRKLVQHSYPNSMTGVVWTPMFLGSGGQAIESARDLLSSEEPTGHDGVRVVEDPRDLVGEFTVALSKFFRLKEVPVAPGAKRIVVPAEVSAFAVNITTGPSAPPVRIEKDGREVALSGRNGAWSAVVSGGGTWRIAAGSPAPEAGRVFLRPRHQWALAVPREVTVTTGTEALRWELRLLDAAGVEPEGDPSAFRLKPTVEARVAGGGKTHTVTMTLTPGKARYGGSLDLAGLPMGEVQIDVDLDRVAVPELPVLASKLTRAVQIVPGVEVVILDPLGRRTAPVLGGVPEEASRVRRLVDRWFPRLSRDGPR